MDEQVNDVVEQEDNVVEQCRCFTEPVNVPYVVFESVQARNERHIKRLVTVIIILLVMLFATNIAWLWVWQQYDLEGYEVEMKSEGEGDALYNYKGEDGDINYGVYPSEKNEQDKERG